MSITGDRLYSRVNFVICLAASVHLISTIVYDVTTVRVLPQFQWAGKLVYLTFWNLCIETLYLGFAAVEHVLSSHVNTKSKILLRKIRDYWFISVVFPLSLLVTATFWCLWSIDRGLLIRKSGLIIPAWLNHSVHTIVCLYSVLELLTTHHNTLASPTKHLLASWLLILLYSLWCVFVWYRSNSWTYPFIEFLTWPTRIAFFIATELICSAFLLLGYYVNNFIAKKNVVKDKKHSRKKL